MPQNPLQTTESCTCSSKIKPTYILCISGWLSVRNIGNACTNKVPLHKFTYKVLYFYILSSNSYSFEQRKMGFCILLFLTDKQGVPIRLSVYSSFSYSSLTTNSQAERRKDRYLLVQSLKVCACSEYSIRNIFRRGAICRVLK